jgi:hypothetical protein
MSQKVASGASSAKPVREAAPTTSPRPAGCSTIRR